jgi:hypothetical protein
MSVPPQPSGIEPLNPAGHVAGVQHVPSCEPLVTHSEPSGHVTHVMSGSPHPWGTGRHDLKESDPQVTGVQHRWSPAPPAHTWLAAHETVQSIEFPVQGSVYVPQYPAGHVVAGSQHVVPLQCVLPSVLPAQVPQESGCPVHGSVGEPH